MTSLLKVHDLHIAYGGIQAVRGIDLDIAEGDLVCLIGANGAGKSSILKGLMGLAPCRGEVRFDDKIINELPTHAIAARGIALVPEGRGLFPRMSVLENLDLGAYRRGSRGRSERAAVRTDLDRVLALFPRLAERRTQLAGTLSGGEQQMLAIARALMGDPRLLLLDEPSMGLAPIMVQAVYDIIRTLGREGRTIFLVEQNAHLALQVSQRAYVMESGSITLAGNSAMLAQDASVRAAYLGE